MNLDTIAYWGAFVIPLALLGIGAWIDKLVEGKPFKRDHFYMGLDLTVYFLASTMVNFLDIAKDKNLHAESIVWTVVMLLAAIVMLLIQMGIHQAWVGEDHKCRMQLVMLCWVSNGLGLLLLYAFVKLKTRGLL